MSHSIGFKVIKGFQIFAIFLFGFGRFASAQPLPNPPQSDPGLSGISQILAPLISMATFSKHVDLAHLHSFTLKDGTRLKGLLFVDESKGVRPLIIADFGLMSSHDTTFAGDIVDRLVQAGKLNANFLVVDDVTSASFFKDNQSLSLGGYDAGRVLIGLADEISNQGIVFSSLHLWGESLGGLAVLEAVIEDQRLGQHHFQSAITFSGVVNEVKSTAAVMRGFGRPLDGLGNFSLDWLGKLFLNLTVKSFAAALQKELPGILAPTPSDAGDYFYNHFQDRLDSIHAADWNPAVSQTSVEDYLKTSNELLGRLSQTQIPVIVIHSHDDPVVDYQQFKVFAQQQNANPKILTHATTFGSHCGFLGTYGADWVAELVNRALVLQ